MNMAISRPPLWADISAPTPQTGGSIQSVSNNTSISSAAYWAGNPNATITDNVIQGQMVTINYEISDIAYTQFIRDPDEIKKILVDKLAQEMWKRNCIEFTKMYDNAIGSHKFHARVFVVPDTQVRILRQNGYDTVAK